MTGTFHDRGDGYCRHCGRTIGWHAGYRCFPPDSKGTPPPVEIDRQLELLADSNWCNRLGGPPMGCRLWGGPPSPETR